MGKPTLVLKKQHKDPFEMLGYCLRVGKASGWSKKEKSAFLRKACKSREELHKVAQQYFNIEKG